MDHFAYLPTEAYPYYTFTQVQNQGHTTSHFQNPPNPQRYLYPPMSSPTSTSSYKHHPTPTCTSPPTTYAPAAAPVPQPISQRHAQSLMPMSPSASSALPRYEWEYASFSLLQDMRSLTAHMKSTRMQWVDQREQRGKGGVAGEGMDVDVDGGGVAKGA